MATSLRGKKSKTVFGGLVLLLLLGLGGFGVTNFGGSAQQVASVGGRDISVNDYGRALQSELQGFSAQVGQPIGMSQAQAMGLDRAVLGQLVAMAALDDRAAEIGISAGDEAVRQQITAARAFQGVNGQFDRELYVEQLRRQGLTPQAFEARIRADAARSVLQGAVAGGVAAPQDYVARVADWAGETRSFRYVRLAAEALAAPVPTPSDADLQAWLEAHPADFTAPETRVVRYAWLSPDALLPSVELDEAALRQAYEDRIEEFRQPERRMVERLVFGTEDEAAAAKAEIEAGRRSFEDFVNDRGLTLEDVDMGEVTKDALGAAGDGVFALAGPGVAGPFQTDLGPALFSMNAILEARDVPFEEARAELSDEAAMDRARRMIADRRASVEDALAGGATIEEIGAEDGMQTGTVDVTQDGADADGFAAYAEVRQAAFQTQPGDFAEVHDLSDGGLFAIEVTEVREPALRPLDAVRQQVSDAWTANATAEALTAQAGTLLAKPDLATAVAGTGLEVVEVSPVTRDGFVEGLPQGAVAKVFTLPEGGTLALPDPASGTALAIRLESIAAPPADDPGRGGIAQQIGQSIAQDALELYTRAAQDMAGVSINQSAVNAVNAQMN
ncbi:peptidylprolyl isomerase [Frigidibacter sp. MR17.24]|uniref:peptidylprolyl isomerase n=1 Tax=Frigidibacter sp. MR17.24 TaxID=3127345 RepID=UPI0030131C3A